MSSRSATPEQRPRTYSDGEEAEDVREPRRARRGTSEDDEDEDDDDEDDDDDDDDEDEDEEDEEGARGGRDRRKKKRRRRGGNRFLDVEAEVDDDEEDLEEDEAELAREDGFIDQDGDDEGNEDRRRQTAADNQRLDRLRREQEDRSAEEIAAGLDERYRLSRTQKSDYSQVPQRMLMPSVNDPFLFSVKCKAGREREITMTMLRKAFAREAEGRPLEIISTFFRDSIPQRMYVEAFTAEAVVEACKEIVGVYARKADALTLVPLDEMADLLRITKVVRELKPGSWVRLKRGRYAGDLAQVIDTSEIGDDVGIKFVPRLDLTPTEAGEFIDSKGRKRKKGSAGSTMVKDRPVAKFFNYDEVSRLVPARERPFRKHGSIVFRGKTYKHGYCEEDVRLSMLITEDVNPTLDEVTRFQGGKEANNSATNAADLDMLVEATRAKAEQVLRRGDHVEVFEGEQAGMDGTVDTVHGDVITIKLAMAGLNHQSIEVPVKSVRKRFQPGDHIKVIAGKHIDETGLVVKVEDNITTFLSDLSLEEVSVFTKDVHEAAEVGSGVTNVGGYNLHDLVQLDAQTAGVIFKIEKGGFSVLDQLGQTRSLLAHQITMKRDSGRAVALDSEGSEFRAGDTMKEIDQDERDGQVLHVYQSMLIWLFNRDLRENGGVFLSRARKLRPKAPRSSTTGPKMDLSKQNPVLSMAAPNAAGGGGGGALSSLSRPGGRDFLAGKTVAITKGAYKTYRGIIKDTNGPMARVELHTMSKILTIELSSLIEKDPITGKSKPLGARPGAPMGPPTGPPMGAGTFGARPNNNPYSAYGTGAAAGSRTPAYNSGGKTPAYGAGNKTPAYSYGDGGRTPAYGFGDGGRTPAYFGGGADGGRTPAYGAAGGRTPAYGAGNRTPACGGSSGIGPIGSATPNPYASANTPRDTAPTPAAYGGAYQGAPTPAATAPTPGQMRTGAYAGAPTPGATPGMYSAQTPGGAPLAAPTPGAGTWGAAYAPTPGAGVSSLGSGNAARPSGAVQVVLFPDIQVIVTSGPYAGSSGAILSIDKSSQTAVVSLEEASKSTETFSLVHLKGKQPRNRGAMCFALASPHEGTRVTVQSIDGEDVMATAHITGQQIFAHASTFALAA